MEPPTWPEYFPSLLEYWDRNVPALEEGNRVTRGFRQALLKATVVFVDLSRLTAETNRYAASPSVCADIVQGLLDDIEMEVGILLDEDVQRIHLDKVLAAGFQFVIPGVVEVSLPIGIGLVAAAFGRAAHPFRIGLHAGEVCLCDLGMQRWAQRRAPFDEVTVMGPVVNLAASLAGAAGDGELVVLGEPIEEGALQPPAVVVPPDQGWLREVEARQVPLNGFNSDRPTSVRVFRGRPIAPPPHSSEATLRRAAEVGRHLPRLDEDA